MIDVVVLDACIEGDERRDVQVSSDVRQRLTGATCRRNVESFIVSLQAE